MRKVAPLASLVALVAVLALAGCGTTEASLSDSVVGTWETISSGNFVVFNDDATYGVGHSVVSASADNVQFADIEFGTWSVQDGVLTFVTDEDSRMCPGVEGSWEVELLNDGDTLGVTEVSDECQQRNGGFGDGATRVTE